MTSERIDPSSLLGYTASHITVTADGGERVAIDDLVGRSDPVKVAQLRALHADLFPDYSFIGPAIERDAQSVSDRGDLVVHQLLVSVDREPAGFVLVDSNLRRRVAAVLFMGLAKPARRLQMSGRPITSWLVSLVLAHLDLDLVGHDMPAAGLGLVGEAVTPAEVRLWSSLGFRRLPVEYAEPAEGWRWTEVGLQLRPVSLVWLPPYALTDEDVQRSMPAAAAAGAAAFLLDHYGLPLDHPMVAAAVGEEANRPSVERPRRL